MASYNKVILMGNLTRMPDVRYGQGNVAVCRISLAINRVWYDEARQKHEEVTYVDVSVFGRQAETMVKYCATGDSLLIDGRLKLDEWTDRATNQKRQKLSVVCESFQFGARARGGNREAAAPAGEAAPDAPKLPEARPPAMPDGSASLDDDVPF